MSAIRVGDRDGPGGPEDFGLGGGESPRRERQCTEGRKGWGEKGKLLWRCEGCSGDVKVYGLIPFLALSPPGV